MSNQEQDKRPAHRPKGSQDKKSDVPRDEVFIHFRCSKGFKHTVKELRSVAGYKSNADVMHEALQILAARKLPGTFYDK